MLDSLLDAGADPQDLALKLRGPREPRDDDLVHLAAAPHDDLVLRRTVGRIGLLDRTAVFDEDSELQDRIEPLFDGLMATPPPPAGPPRDELLRRARRG